MSDSDDRTLAATTLVIRSVSGRLLLTIGTDGTLVYGPDYTPDEAASAFWRAVALKRAEVDGLQVRIATPAEVGLLDMERDFNEWEPVMQAAGYADIARQNAETKRNELLGTPNKAEFLKADLEATKATEHWHECGLRLVEVARTYVLRQHGVSEFEDQKAQHEPSPKGDPTLN